MKIKTITTQDFVEGKVFEQCSPKIIAEGQEINEDGVTTKWWEVNCETCNKQDCPYWIDYNSVAS